MKYTGIELLQVIKDKKIKEKTKIRVLYLGLPTKHILKVTEDNLIWEPGEFYVGELWDENYTFEVIEEKPKKIEEMECNVESWFTPSQADIEIIKKVNEIRNAVNYLLEKESDK